ncbi:hypothetical protein PN498_02645 [Oscillatoria sp. CS-180]|uniref:hypothetical protein n=1 Tax=Oscillatoria sp. CS-180 TaxID=3021720 RepID=UPI00232B690E|nr:hypothetical protein [Oscillatoria sp. CS-180]MDB9524874.1 hypothetical protein [Oscillatoria sp. CS-180]
MKPLLIQLLVLPRGLVFLSIFCTVGLMFLSLPAKSLAEGSGGDQFPGQRQGGGTHVTFLTAILR